MKQILDVEVKSWHLRECLDKFEMTPFTIALMDHLKIWDSSFFCSENGTNVHIFNDKMRIKDRKYIKANYLTMKDLYACFYKFVKAYSSIRNHKPPRIEDILGMGDACKRAKAVCPFSFKAEVDIESG